MGSPVQGCTVKAPELLDAHRGTDVVSDKSVFSRRGRLGLGSHVRAEVDRFVEDRPYAGGCGKRRLVCQSERY